MSDRLNALGQYIIEQTKRNFNFKQTKNDPIYYYILFIFFCQYILFSLYLCYTYLAQQTYVR